MYFHNKSLKMKCFLWHCLIRNAQEPPSLTYILSLCNSSDTYLSIYRVFFLLVFKDSFASRFERKWFPLILSRNKVFKVFKVFEQTMSVCNVSVSVSVPVSVLLSVMPCFLILLVNCQKGRMRLGQLCFALKVINQKTTHSLTLGRSDNVTYWAVLDSQKNDQTNLCGLEDKVNFIVLKAKPDV